MTNVLTAVSAAPWAMFRYCDSYGYIRMMGAEGLL